MKYLKLFILTGLILISCKGEAQKVTTKKEIVKETKSEFPIQKTDAEWQKQLTPLQYQILRKAGTENPFTSEFLNNKKDGIYVCAACGTELFVNKYKFDSGTGWPSFDRAIKGNVAYSVDYKIGYKRVEEHCANCGGHLGHVFDDGPKTTGKRHCINGAALKFAPKAGPHDAFTIDEN